MRIPEYADTIAKPWAYRQVFRVEPLPGAGRFVAAIHHATEGGLYVLDVARRRLARIRKTVLDAFAGSLSDATAPPGRRSRADC